MTSGTYEIRGDRLVRLREVKDWTQMEAAYRCKTNQGNLSRMERGLLKNITLDTLIALADGFNTTIEYIIGATNDPRPRDATPLDKLADDAAELVLVYMNLSADNKDLLRSLAERLQELEQQASHPVEAGQS